MELAVASGAKPWHTADGEPYIDVASDDQVRRTLRIRSRACRTWLSGLMYKAEKSALGGQSASDAVEVLAAMAVHEGPLRKIHVRLAVGDDRALYVDMADSTWGAIRVSPDGWSIVTQPPVRFRRPRAVRPLPVPLRRDTAWEEFAELLGLDPASRDFILVVAWMIGAFHPSGPYPALGLAGEHGSGKTTAGRTIRAMIDPSEAPLRSPPREDREVIIAARNGHIIGLDNVSYLPVWLSDALCRIATGGGYSARELYTDGEEVVYADRRPIILTSIEEVATRADLADRTVAVTLPRIPEHQRRTEREMSAALDALRPGVLAALMDAVVVGLRRQHAVRLPRLPRMADYAAWVVACEPALPWPEGAFLTAYEEARADTVQTATEADPVAVAILELLEAKGQWSGTSAELLEELNARRPHGTRPPRKWPETARSLSGRVTRAAPLLRAAGWEVLREREGGSGRRIIHLVQHSAETDRHDGHNRHTVVPDPPSGRDGERADSGEVDRCRHGHRHDQGPDAGEDISASRAARDGGDGGIRSRASTTTPPTGDSRARAVGLLLKTLADGPQPLAVLGALARDSGILLTALEDAQHALGVKSYEDLDGEMWELPAEFAPDLWIGPEFKPTPDVLRDDPTSVLAGDEGGL